VGVWGGAVCVSCPNRGSESSDSVAECAVAFSAMAKS